MQHYYDARLSEYDEVYRKPERQDDLKILRMDVQRRLNDKDVLELACGTGYWTAIASKSARSIFATDISDNALAIARQRSYLCPVEFAVADAFRLQDLPAADVTMAMFWLSHVPKQDLERFLYSVRAASRRGGTALFVDNRFVRGSSTSVGRLDEQGNTFQLRKLRNGSTYEVLKNFPTGAEIAEVLSKIGDGVDVLETKYYWIGQVLLRP